MMLFLFVPMLVWSLVSIVAIVLTQEPQNNATGAELVVFVTTFVYFLVNIILWGYLTLYSLGVLGGAWV
jgi:glucose uptake protein GlcU